MSETGTSPIPHGAYRKTAAPGPDPLLTGTDPGTPMKDGLNFPAMFQDIPVMDWERTRDGHGVTFIAGRRVDGKAPPDTAKGMSEDGGETLHSFVSDTTLRVPRLPDRDEDRVPMKAYGGKVYAVVAEVHPLPSRECHPHIPARLDELDGGARDAAE